MAKKHKTVRGKREWANAVKAAEQRAQSAGHPIVRPGESIFDAHRRERNRRRAALVALGLVFALVVLIAGVFVLVDKLGAF